MTQPRAPQLLDIIAVLNNRGNASVQVGDVGTVVEVLPPHGLEVEFLNRNGRTRCVATFHGHDVLVLNRERTPVGVSVFRFKRNRIGEARRVKW